MNEPDFHWLSKEYAVADCGNLFQTQSMATFTESKELLDTLTMLREQVSDLVTGNAEILEEVDIAILKALKRINESKRTKDR